MAAAVQPAKLSLDTTGLGRQPACSSVPSLVDYQTSYKSIPLLHLHQEWIKPCIFYLQCGKIKLKTLTPAEDFPACWHEQEDALGEEKLNERDLDLSSQLCMWKLNKAYYGDDEKKALQRLTLIEPLL